MGRPRANRIAVVEAASRTLSQIACQSISIPRHEETVLVQDALAGGGKQESAEITGRRGILEDNAALLHARISVPGDLPVTAAGSQGRRLSERHGDDPGVGGTAFHK